VDLPDKKRKDSKVEFKGFYDLWVTRDGRGKQALTDAPFFR
jgi:hypothetical protein